MCILREGSCVPEQKWKPWAGILSTAGALSRGDWTIPPFRHALSTYRERVLVFSWDISLRSPLRLYNSNCDWMKVVSFTAHRPPLDCNGICIGLEILCNVAMSPQYNPLGPLTYSLCKVTHK